MKLLVIGGGRFAGRAIVEAALAEGHAVSTFNRGSQPALPGVQAIIGDRRGDLSALHAGRWDAVIDCCGYLPREVAAMADALAHRVGRYVFLSSVSVYADHSRPCDESAATGTLADPATEVVDGDTYGPLKAACEAVLAARLPGRHLSLRPTLIVGPHDPTGRFSWWPARAARARAGEPMLWPGDPLGALQWIDARDLARFALAMAAQGPCGVLNVGSPAGRWRWGDLADACVAAAGTGAVPVWVPESGLQAAGVQPWMELPLWIPADGAHDGFLKVDCRRAEALGLQCRPVAATVADTLAWWRALPPQAQAFPNTGLSPEREQALLAAVA
ncbi:NAD-dependent epimerase/dehydratase family protein [Ideonella sp. 4Y11]|uniref:NAD-dependent epimerase/dehydratase family protein n=1 Tax=Ideonella aquatica TaxID=2824119 RepID=A0A940YMW5_9BURK|nr:NAD-dependent epimerase/dehydratase family protein [Ideonella aquatica]MBQ0958853.1 NAD-dependent epimerase/dehydratase family protein [Ideonella aquatica]